MTTPNYNSLTLAPPGITVSRFTSLLQSKNSPATPYASQIYSIMINSGVDPAFALAQFRVESQYGTSGYATETHSWGNMLFDKNLTILNCGTYSVPNYTYAKYCNWDNSVTDYCRYIHDYAENRGLKTIYDATAEWIGKVPGSPGHLNYINTIIDDMISYEFPNNTFYETGDAMIWADSISNLGMIHKKYPITTGTTLYRGTDGTVLKKYSGANGNAWFIGLCQGATNWGAILINTPMADPSGYTLVYIKDIDKSKIISV